MRFRDLREVPAFARHTVDGTYATDPLRGSGRLRRTLGAGADPLPLCDPPAPPAWAGGDLPLCS
ncbi:hypothetical protein [Streptomyces malaysiense]|uniref:Uncharacterized protein n=1 Tax=Streptomyces malaysiense TaxID=1428626 RepID=A0A1J4Q798_9ACTN|nr:hypothetical protein [Streptomyces malaysiense]OIK29107.1 hypothetical protein VT52_003315 [Streptomyces malaysiense]